jgi:hypothetical protein
MAQSLRCGGPDCAELPFRDPHVAALMSRDVCQSQRRAAGSNQGKKVLSSGFMGRTSKVDGRAIGGAALERSGAVTRDVPSGDGLFVFSAASAMRLSV